MAPLRLIAGETLQLERNEIDQRLQRAEDSHNQERWTENSPQFVESCKELQDKAIEKIRPYARDRQFLISLLRKYNNGQETYKNLQDQIKKTDAKIKKVVRSFNGLGCADTIDEGAALSLQSNVYSYKEVPSKAQTPFFHSPITLFPKMIVFNPDP
ncbi:hypothetical protein CAPTEDRAFT_211502 [Capitella teleta]|uniref:Uncharacterized protein n=1 Tax=Capitella teleta TaxID=283909 RepID=R7UBV6_CAPTE|nr:hypothetical protein CAPTEDRAFT_211502 [Capitella teleta]|eukprot:ELU03444.1 hypothetical protein CAPTEDRAFT_211502 [Capitella teleta]